MLDRKKCLLIGLIILLLALQYKLWLAGGGILDMLKLRKEYHKTDAKTQLLEKRNQKLLTEVKAIQANKQSIETQARGQLGMVKQGEEFYQIVQTPKKESISESTTE